MDGSIILYILLVGVLGYLIYEKWERKGLLVYAGALAAVAVCALLGWVQVVFWATYAACSFLIYLLFDLAGMGDGMKKGCAIILVLGFVGLIIISVVLMRSCESIADSLSKKNDAIVRFESCDTLYGGVIDRVEYSVMMDGSIHKDSGKGAYATDTVMVTTVGGLPVVRIDDHLLVLHPDSKRAEIVVADPVGRHLHSELKSVDWEKVSQFLDKHR